MSPTHHVPEDLLVEYASGAASEPIALLVATHLALCPACREREATLEDVGGELMDALEPAPMKAGVEDLFALLDAAPEVAPEAAPQRAPEAPPPGGFVLPQPLRGYVGRLDAVQWRTILPGIQEIELPIALGGVPVRLTRLRPGVTVPTHTHSDEEFSLVLAGGFEDDFGHFVRGDVSAYGPEQTHTQHIDSGEPCITLAVNRGRMIPTDWKGKLIGKIVGGF